MIKLTDCYFDRGTMVLAKLIKKSFFCVIENPTIAISMVLFIIAVNLLSSYIVSSKIKSVAMILMLCLFGLISLFIAGWMKIFKETTDREQIKNKNYYSIFLEGIGENVVSCACGLIIYFIAFGITIFLAREFAIKVFGSLDFLSIIAQNSSNNFIEYFNNLTTDQKYIVYAWQFTFISAIAMFNFLSLFYFPIIVYDKRNIFLRPITALYKAIVFVFKHFFEVLIMCILIHITHFILAILNTMFSANAILLAVLLFIYIYFASIVVMLIFNYYEEKNNSSDRSDSIGENKAIGEVSTQD